MADDEDEQWDDTNRNDDTGADPVSAFQRVGMVLVLAEIEGNGPRTTST